MKKRCLTILMSVLVLTMAFAGGASAKTVSRTGIGYMYANLQDVNEILKASGFKELSNNHFYATTTTLFELNKVDNLYIGFSNSNSRTSSKNDNKDIAVFSTNNFSGVVGYGLDISDKVGIEVGTGLGLAVSRFETRRQFVSEGDNPILGLTQQGNRVTIWRPYLAITPYVSLTAKFQFISLDVSAGYDFNVGMGNWFDRMDPIENTKDVQKTVKAGHISLGLSLAF